MLNFCMKSRLFIINPSVLTLLSGPVEDLDVFELHPNTSPQRHRVCGIVFTSPLYRAIGMRPA